MNAPTLHQSTSPALALPPPFASLDALDRFFAMGFSYRLPDTEEPRRKVKAPAKSARKKSPRRTHLTVHESRDLRKVFKDLATGETTLKLVSSSKDAAYPKLKAKISPTLWRKLSKKEKAILFGLYISQTYTAEDSYKRGYAFSVNIDQARLVGVDDIAGTLLDRITKALARRGIKDCPLLISLHSKKEKGREVHIHGSVIIAPNQTALFMEAVLTVVGVWRPDGRGERQSHFEPRYGFTTWEVYSTSEDAATRRHLLDDLKCESGRTTAMTRSAIRATREFFEMLGFTRDAPPDYRAR